MDPELADPSGPELPSPRRPGWLWWTVGAVTIVVVLVGAAFGARFGLDPSTVDSPMIGQRIPDVTLPRLEGDGDVTLRDVDAEVTVVNFWASWCVPCRNEHDDLLAAATRYEDDGVRFFGIVYQDQDDRAVEFLDELGRGYDHLVDPGSKAALDFGVFGIPETYVIDADGVIRAKIVGESDVDLLSRTIEDVLAGRQPGSQTVGDTESR